MKEGAERREPNAPSSRMQTILWNAANLGEGEQLVVTPAAHGFKS
jgi:hypothetical protein